LLYRSLSERAWQRDKERISVFIITNIAITLATSGLKLWTHAEQVYLAWVWTLTVGVMIRRRNVSWPAYKQSESTMNTPRRNRDT
jgi:hypothetical protein